MIAARSQQGLNQFVKAVTQSAGGQRVVTSIPSLKRDHEERAAILPDTTPAFASNMAYHKVSIAKPVPLVNQLLKGRGQAITGIGVGHQYRCAHTDVQIPSFQEYRRPSTADPTKPNGNSVDDRRAFTYVMTAGAGIGGAVAAKAITHGLVQMLSPARDCLALSKIEVNIGNIPEGKNVVVKWRGKPVFVRHRTQAEVDHERGVDIGSLRDPETDEKRAPHGKWLVVIGICTHLGCVPIANKGDFNGYYCPCHGSHYDASGRIRKGPAPLNLEVPEYTLDGDELVVG